MMTTTNTRWAPLAWALIVPAALTFAVFLKFPEAGHDYVCFHAVGRLVLEGTSPYDRAGHHRLQQGYAPGLSLGMCERQGFLPYFYPPWFALAVSPLAALPFAAARAVWVYLTLAGPPVSAVLLCRGLPRLAWPAALTLAVLFFPDTQLGVFGATTGFVLALLTGAWYGLECGRDRTAGALLALAMFKPHLALPAVAALNLWAARRGRWRVFAAFALTTAVLVGAGTAVAPGWLREWPASIREMPRGPDLGPDSGMTWSCVMRLAGLRGPALAAAWALAAGAAVAPVVVRAVGLRRPAIDVLAPALLAGFAVSPYALLYDLSLLLVPLLCVCAGSVRSTSGQVLTSLVAAVVAFDTALVLNRYGAPLCCLVAAPALLGLWLLTRSPATDRSESPLDLVVGGRVFRGGVNDG